MGWWFTDDVEAYAASAWGLLAGNPVDHTVALSVIASVRAGHRWSEHGQMLFGCYDDGEVRGASSPDAALRAAARRRARVAPKPAPRGCRWPRPGAGVGAPGSLGQLLASGVDLARCASVLRGHRRWPRGGSDAQPLHGRRPDSGCSDRAHRRRLRDRAMTALSAIRAPLSAALMRAADPRVFIGRGARSIKQPARPRLRWRRRRCVVAGVAGRIRCWR